MDDMQLVREFGTTPDLARPADLAAARAKLMATARAEKAPRRRPFAWLGFTAVGLAAAITGVVVLGGEVGLPTPSANAEAAEVLNAAARAALTLPDTPPRADQYLYIKSQDGAGIAERWKSVDGTHDNLFVFHQRGERHIWPGCRDGRRLSVGGNVPPKPGETEPCEPDPAYLGHLPTDADAMLEYMRRNVTGTPGKPGSVASYVRGLAESHLPPRSRAALFEASAKMPGLSLRRGVTDAAGRPGVGIAWSDEDGASGVIVFDEKTHAYLGTEETAMLAFAVVDKQEQR